MLAYTNLRDSIDDRFDKDEVLHLCFDLQIDFDNLNGSTKISKIEAMIQHLRRRDRIDELLIICKQLRPSVDWYDISGSIKSPVAKREDAEAQKNQGFPDLDVEKFLKTSNLTLTSVDKAILTYGYPFLSQDWGWQDHEIDFKPEDTLVNEIPTELVSISQTFRYLNPDRKNSIKYCVDKMYCSLSENGLLRIETRSIPYLIYKPIAEELGKTLITGGSIRDRWFSRMVTRQRPLHPNVLCAHILVVTGDNKLLLQKRTANLDYNSGTWSASFEEQLNAPWQSHLSPEEVYENSVDISIFDGIKRGLLEELRLTKEDITQSILRVLGIGVEFTNFSACIYAIAELPKHLTHTALKEYLKSLPEHDNYYACDFETQNLIDCVRTGTLPLDLRQEVSKNEWEWHPTSRMRIYLALMRRLGPSAFLSLLAH